ncbi:PREDICTED: uncharacterized protein LOC104810726 [Tarenaya hassleriana]|uniref:uncharacterized protein LOC104810726 n=1 Tax=Tarenaya hassleriana TaxID=28532 RepID=UPI00053C4699|nr:PREDICTED: uncharacterized protein LOC104810726 [Tarenaya hassleriana]
MGIDVKDLGTVLWKILGCSLDLTLEFARTHPVFSSVSVFLLALYIFLPSVFYFLIYSSPVLACIVVYALEKLESRRLGQRNDEEKLPSSLEVEKSVDEKVVARSHLIHQRSVRRNARMKVDKWDSHTSDDDDDKDKVILTSLYNDLLGRTPHFEDSPKGVENDVEDKEEDSHKGDSSQIVKSSRPSYDNLGVLGVGKQILSSCETKEEEEGKEDKEVYGKEERSEQKNGGELRISEIESQRLESLIARRKARRLFKLALDQKNMTRGDETVSSTHNILQISVPKNNRSFLGKHRDRASKDVIGLQMPGSAPSVLLPVRNPFDIPYDPHEERPILKGDSFDLEFSAFNQKDLFFSRHESFCRPAHLSSETVQYIDSPDSVPDSTHLDSGNDYEDRVKQKHLQEGKKATNVTKMTVDKEGSVESGKSSIRVTKMNEETDSDKESNGDLSSSADSEPEFSVLNRAELREAIRHSMENFPGFPMNHQARNNIPSPMPRGMPPRFDDHHMFYAGRCSNSHTRTYSIASDLQVEVSELGSPPTTVDWHDDSSNGGESYMYDTDIDREIAYGEELHKRGSHQPESKLRSETRSDKENNGSDLDTEDRSDEHTKKAVDETADDNSGRSEHSLVRKSVSLSSIAEEPETKLDSVDVGNQEELTDQRHLNSLFQPIENLGDYKTNLQDVAQMETNDRVEINSGEEEKNFNFTEVADGECPDTLYNDGENRHGLNDSQNDHDTEVVQESGSNEVDDGLNTSKIDQNLGLVKKGDTPDGDDCGGMLDNSAENMEPETTFQLEQEAAEDKEMKLVECADEMAQKTTETEEAQNIVSMSSGHPHADSPEADVVGETEQKVGREETQNVLNISPGHHLVTNLIEQKLVEGGEPELVEDKAQTIEH